jgi:uncharacterized membrane protein
MSSPASPEALPSLEGIDVPAPIPADGHDRRRRRIVANRAFGALKAKHASERTAIQAIADQLNDIASSPAFLVIHALWFLVWIPWNIGLFGLRPFDPYPFGLLTMVVSLEAIFLSIFVLMAQKRESAIAELREELALQVNMRIEEEVTKSLQLVAGLYTRLGHRVAQDPELLDMIQPLDIDALERDLATQIESEAAPASAQRHVLTAVFVAHPGAPDSLQVAIVLRYSLRVT